MGNSHSDELHESLSDRDIARQLIQQQQLKGSERSNRSGSHEGRSPSIHSKDLTSNLMRQQKNRDPLFYYEVLKVLGVGSMGSVSMVRKRDEFIGGSARRKLVKSIRRQKRYEDCFSLPVIGPLFRYIMERSKMVDDVSRHQRNISGISQNSNLSQISNEANKQGIASFALKSIHLNRVTDKVFVSELKNEIEILKSLVRGFSFAFLFAELEGLSLR